MTAQEIIAALPGAFDPARAEGVDADVQLHLSGNQGGEWVVSVRNGACAVKPGTVANPAVSISADGQDFVDLVGGKLNPMMAVMTGKLKVQGDMALATRFPSMFKG